MINFICLTEYSVDKSWKTIQTSEILINPNMIMCISRPSQEDLPKCLAKILPDGHTCILLVNDTVIEVLESIDTIKQMLHE